MIRFEVQTTWFEPILCSTLREAVELRDEYPYSRIVKHGYAPVDEDDDGLTAVERDAIARRDSPARDVLIALIDGAAAAA